MELIREVLKRDFAKKLVFFIAFFVFLYLIRSIINLLLLTFLFTYLIYSLQEFITKKISKIVHINHDVISLALYTIIISFIIFIAYKYLPKILEQSLSILEQISDSNFSLNTNYIPEDLLPLMQKLDVQQYMKTVLGYTVSFVTDLGAMSVNAVLAFILSMTFIFGEKKIVRFIKRFKTSKISGIYNFLEYYGVNFLNSFGKVIQAQVIIAIVNTLLSVFMLYLIGFPKLVALSFMILILSLIPVAGVVISLIPLTIIGFKIGGIITVSYVLIMVIIIHAVEAYFLNPKLMSSKTKIPVFFTFIILIVSEHFLGIWGLLLGIPLFIFLLDVIEVEIPQKE